MEIGRFRLQVQGGLCPETPHPKPKPPRRKNKLRVQISSFFPDPYHWPWVTENSKGNKNSKGKSNNN